MLSQEVKDRFQIVIERMKNREYFAYGRNMTGFEIACYEGPAKTVSIITDMKPNEEETLIHIQNINENRAEAEAFVASLLGMY